MTPRERLLTDALKEARLQIEYLHDKFKETGSGNAVLAKIKAALATPASTDTVTLRMVWTQDSPDSEALRVGKYLAGWVWRRGVDDIWFAEIPGSLSGVRSPHPTLTAAKAALEAAVRAMEAGDG